MCKYWGEECEYVDEQSQKAESTHKVNPPSEIIQSFKPEKNLERACWQGWQQWKWCHGLTSLRLKRDQPPTIIAIAQDEEA